MKRAELTRARVHAMNDALRDVAISGASPLAWLLPELATLLDAPSVFTCRPSRSGEGWAMTDFHGLGMTSGFRASYERLAFSSAKMLPTMFDPVLPEPAQRNAVVRLAMSGWQHVPRVARVVEDVWPKVGVGGHDHMRALVCDDGLILTSLNVFRPKSFARHEEASFDALLPTLSKTLAIHRKLRDADLVRVGLASALDAITAPAFIVDGSGAVAHANQTARHLIGADARFDYRAFARAAGKGRTNRLGSDRCLVKRLSHPGLPAYYLVVLHGSDAEISSRVAKAVRQWRLTPRRAEVLRCLLHGDANKTIAEKLSCAEVTVEAHVTTLLRRTQTESRTQLVARVWMLV